MRMCRTFTGMCLVRRSLGPNGCGVKQRNRRFGQKSHLVHQKESAASFRQFRQSIESSCASRDPIRIGL
jgi:hypothetical protein